jgi:hypothetical protein
MSFKRTIEDFTCEHCGSRVHGNGFTNHCPKCLWSKHVDNDPGDRAAPCGGMMEPIAIEGSSPNYRLVHTCIKCGIVRRVSLSTEDDPEVSLALARKHMS